MQVYKIKQKGRRRKSCPYAETVTLLDRVNFGTITKTNIYSFILKSAKDGMW